MVDAVFSSPFVLKAHRNKKRTLFDEKTQNKKLKESEASQRSAYKLDWKYVYKNGQTNSITPMPNAESAN